MNNLEQVINNDLKQSMREKNELTVSVLRMLISALKNKKIESKNREDLKKDEVISIIGSELKKRKDSIEAYVKGDRQDLADKESSEIVILEKYMPEQMSEEEVEKIVQEVISSLGEVTMQDFGKVMGQAMGKLKGKADGNMVSSAVKKALSS